MGWRGRRPCSHSVVPGGRAFPSPAGSLTNCNMCLDFSTRRHLGAKGISRCPPAGYKWFYSSVYGRVTATTGRPLFTEPADAFGLSFSPGEGEQRGLQFSCENTPLFRKSLLKSCKGFEAPTMYNTSLECSVPVGTCYSPGAALPNSHRLDGLKQQNCVLSPFWRETKEPKIKVSGPHFLGRLQEHSVLASPSFWW